mmetsp:Transcript_30204/g.63996  ORF Transcript_30204/g.63996 Transcript_30204/m.63996 type:complete len:87 (-) Transcript_30204:341-601(-)|eukprot:CAMPEP_0172300434 /NCGR_PEP_ID=MMETSP1058-20130122/2529_1 /TAXON_ID=83371 /ORGANISM="Detonula confervacea, Strain CCMP 353" /LENGTH=86 /DNA_ID=CAMNT_0013010211 /DNA_START=247 /DNA_END=507 /DNA_ORIENTATION=-
MYFLDGFSKFYYQDMFKFLMKNDPMLGRNTFGQMARFGPERCYVMHQKLSELENGGWREKPEFDKFKNAMSGVGGGVNAFRCEHHS